MENCSVILDLIKNACVRKTLNECCNLISLLQKRHNILIISLILLLVSFIICRLLFGRRRARLSSTYSVFFYYHRFQCMFYHQLTKAFLDYSLFHSVPHLLRSTFPVSVKFAKYSFLIMYLPILNYKCSF